MTTTTDELRKQLVYSHMKCALNTAGLSCHDAHCFVPMAAAIDALCGFKTHDGDGSFELNFENGMVNEIIVRDHEGKLLWSTIIRPDGSQVEDDDVDFELLMSEPNRVYAALGDGAEFVASIRGALLFALRMSWGATQRLFRRTFRRMGR